MLNKTNKPQPQLITRSFFETSSNKFSENSNSSRGSQLNFISSNSSVAYNQHPLNNQNTQSVPFQYRNTRFIPQLPHNPKNSMGATSNALNYQYLNPMGLSSWATQKPNYDMNVDVQNEIKTERQRGPNKIAKNQATHQESTTTNKEQKGQETQETVTEEVSQASCQRTFPEKSVKACNMLINNLDSIREELKEDLDKCRNKEEIHEAFMGKINSFDQTICKVLNAYKRVGSHLTRFEGIISEKFEIIVGNFEKNDQKIEETQDVITNDLNAKQNTYFRRLDKIRKNIKEFERLNKIKVNQPKKAEIKKKNEAPKKSRLAQPQTKKTKEEKKEIILTKSKPENEVSEIFKTGRPRGRPRSRPWENETNENLYLPPKKVKAQKTELAKPKSEPEQKLMEIQKTKDISSNVIIKGPRRGL